MNLFLMKFKTVYLKRPGLGIHLYLKQGNVLIIAEGANLHLKDGVIVKESVAKVQLEDPSNAPLQGPEGKEKKTDTAEVKEPVHDTDLETVQKDTVEVEGNILHIVTLIGTDLHPLKEINTLSLFHQPEKGNLLHVLIKMIQVINPLNLKCLMETCLPVLGII